MSAHHSRNFPCCAHGQKSRWSRDCDYFSAHLNLRCPSIYLFAGMACHGWSEALCAVVDGGGGGTRAGDGIARKINETLVDVPLVGYYPNSAARILTRFVCQVLCAGSSTYIVSKYSSWSCSTSRQFIHHTRYTRVGRRSRSLGIWE